MVELIPLILLLLTIMLFEIIAVPSFLSQFLFLIYLPLDW